ncbi:nucleotidyltransferase [Brachionus plicatilis]|uniref:Nucleotidyltransferase n=1 Tax=Brachionus plicatilis TaxID=10195 RepID=A0A3M7SQ25_BRAPC|nr:nucleotidyltransferase [Brachionus plicatilis]
MEKIESILRDLEKRNDIKIIYAIEAGSRAWGFESNDSDYDIRFIYIHENRKKYLSLTALKETIDGFSDDRVYDWQGWDITKCLKLIQKVNPTITEWLYSPIVYLIDDQFENYIKHMKNLLIEQNRLSPLLNHYRSMAKSNYKSHIKGKNEVNIKKYLYVIRPIGMFQWLLNRPIKDSDVFYVNFDKVLHELKPHLKENVNEKINEIIDFKRNSNEANLGSRIECIDEWIEDLLENKSIVEIEKNDSLNAEVGNHDKFDQLLHEILRVEFR